MSQMESTQSTHSPQLQLSPQRLPTTACTSRSPPSRGGSLKKLVANGDDSNVSSMHNSERLSDERKDICRPLAHVQQRTARTSRIHFTVPAVDTFKSASVQISEDHVPASVRVDAVSPSQALTPAPSAAVRNANVMLLQHGNQIDNSSQIPSQIDRVDPPRLPGVCDENENEPENVSSHHTANETAFHDRPLPPGTAVAVRASGLTVDSWRTVRSMDSQDHGSEFQYVSAHDDDLEHTRPGNDINHSPSPDLRLAVTELPVLRQISGVSQAVNATIVGCEPPLSPSKLSKHGFRSFLPSQSESLRMPFSQHSAQPQENAATRTISSQREANGRRRSNDHAAAFSESPKPARRASVQADEKEDENDVLAALHHGSGAAGPGHRSSQLSLLTVDGLGARAAAYSSPSLGPGDSSQPSDMLDNHVVQSTPISAPMRSSLSPYSSAKVHPIDESKSPVLSVGRKISHTPQANRVAKLLGGGSHASRSPSQQPKWAKLAAHGSADVNHQLNEDELRLAVAYVMDAVNFWSCKHHTHPQGVRLYMFYRTFTLRLVYFLLVMLNCFVLSWAELTPGISVDEKEYRNQNLGQSQGMDIRLLAIPELLMLTLIMGESLLRYYAVSRTFRGDYWTLTKLSCFLIIVIDLLIYLAVFPNGVRVSRILRVYFVLSYNLDMRAQTQQVIKTLIKVAPPAILLLFITFCEALFAIILFYSPDGPQPPQTPAELITSLTNSTATTGVTGFNDDYHYSFSTLFQAWLQTFYLCTAVNFPDVALPQMRQYGQGASLFFILCVVLNLYIATNLMIAFVYSVYRKAAVEGAKEKWVLRQQALLQAFEAVDVQHKGHVTEEEWTKLFNELCRYGVVRGNRINNLASIYFDAIDEDGSGKAELVEFYRLCDLLLSRVDEVDDVHEASIIKARVRELFEEQIAILMLRVIFVVFDAAIVVYVFYAAADSSAIFIPLWAFVLDNLLLVWFICEFFISVWLSGWSDLRSNVFQQFHGVILSVSLLAKIVLEFALQPALNDSGLLLIRLAFIFRIVRVLRVFCIIRFLREGVRSIGRLLWSLSSLILMIFCVYYIFAIVGMMIYGNMLSNVSDFQVQLTLYSEWSYNDIVSFDSFGQTFFLLFHLMAINNWHFTAEAAIAATSQWSIIYFMSFWFMVHITLLNLLVAFILEYIRHLSGEQKKVKQKELEEQQHRADQLPSKQEDASKLADGPVKSLHEKPVSEHSARPSKSENQQKVSKFGSKPRDSRGASHFRVVRQGVGDARLEVFKNELE